jgi:hypothetical protein
MNAEELANRFKDQIAAAADRTPSPLLTAFVGSSQALIGPLFRQLFA